ncbi:FBP domain-containing protein [soil metagenome]
MLALDQKTIRASFVNASKKEVSDLTFAPDFAALDWDRLDYLGWRDPKIGKRAYIVVPLDDGPVGIILKQADATPRTRAQCSWCQDVQLPNDVVMFVAKRAGAAGRNGNTVGTLICDEFQCSANVRKSLPMAYLGFDVEAARQERIVSLRERSANFAIGIVAPD